MAEAENKVGDNYLNQICKLIKDQKLLNKKSEEIAEKYINQAMNAYENSDLYILADPILDPSGYLYEGVLSNRVSEVKATIRYRDPETEEVIVWDASEYNQYNPLYSNSRGEYAWDVPEGQWQVMFEKDGYETVYSEWLPVPPEQLDVNIGMVAESGPSVEFVNLFNDSIQIVFDQYVDIASVNSDNIILTSNGTAVKGVFEAEDEQTNPADHNTKLARVFNYITYKPPVGTVDCSINRVVNYSGKAMEDEYTATLEAVTAISSVSSEDVVTIPYSTKGVIKIKATPVEAAVGKTVSISANDNYLISIQENVMFDDNGIATIQVSSLLPGESIISYTIDGTTISGKIKVESTIDEAVMVDYLLGDADGNGDVDIVDATFIQRYLAQIETPYTKAELIRGDVDDSGDLEIIDVTAIQYYLVYMNTPFQIGKAVN